MCMFVCDCLCVLSLSTFVYVCVFVCRRVHDGVHLCMYVYACVCECFVCVSRVAYAWLCLCACPWVCVFVYDRA